MPWQATRPMDQRLQFVGDHQRALYDMTTLCARHGVSRKTGYKWLARYAAEGAQGSPSGAVCRITARIASPTSWRRCCSLPDAHIRAGGRRSSCSISHPGTRACRRGPPSAPSLIS